MLIGYLYDTDEKKVKEDVKKGVNVSIGVSVDSVLNDILIHEINTGGNPALVLSELKKELMIILEKIKVEVKDEPKAEN